MKIPLSVCKSMGISPRLVGVHVVELSHYFLRFLVETAKLAYLRGKLICFADREKANGIN
jgi:hypothetical protein